MNHPTGAQHRLTRGDASATITEVAASLRAYTVGGVDLVQTYPEFSAPPLATGIILAPWPNRVADGRWRLDGVDQQLDLTEVARGNAIHGLLRFTAYGVVERSDEAITLGAPIFPQHGYPFHLDTTVRYELGDDELRVTHTVHNLSEQAAPVGLGAHPYLTIGDVPTADLVLTVPAAVYVNVDDRLLPKAELPVDGTKYDLRSGARVGDLELDTAFGSLGPGPAATLRAPDGREVRLVQDDNHPYAQVFTTPNYPGAPFAVALEPMTAAPDALNSGRGLRWVDPGETWAVSWGIQYSR